MTGERLLEIARREIGQAEVPGPGDNPRINEYLATVGLSDDQTPWCSAFVNWVYSQAGMRGSGKANARSWLDWGEEVLLAEAQPGDVAVLWRGDPYGWQGHVGLFVRGDDRQITLLGGNQHNAVGEQTFPTYRLLGLRRAE